MTGNGQTAFMREMQIRFDKKLREHEIASLLHWKEEVDRIAAMKPEGIAALQTQVLRLSDRMANRIRMLKKE